MIDANSGQPIPFATVTTNSNTHALSSAEGKFTIQCTTSTLITLTLKHPKYQSKSIETSTKGVEKIEITLQPKEQITGTTKLDLIDTSAMRVINEVFRKKKQNNPQKALSGYNYTSYNKLKITADNQTQLRTPDTTNVDIEHLFNQTHSFLSEKISEHRFKKNVGEKENVLATRMTGFKEPIHTILGITIQSNSLYNEEYTIFDNTYIGPLAKNALKNYHYRIVDTVLKKRPAYVVLFQPRKSKNYANLEGVLYIDKESFAIQKAVIELKGELDVMAIHEFKYFTEEKIWFPTHQEITIRQGNRRHKVGLFGGQISVGRLGGSEKDDTIDINFLNSSTDLFDIELNKKQNIKQDQAFIQIDPKANIREESYWNKYRTSAITQKDINSFKAVDSIVKEQNIGRKIDVIQNFNKGYYPIGFFNFDLTYPIKYNNYEGFRLGLGGVTNTKLSKNFRLEGYLVYGFNDDKYKYGLGGGFLFNKNKGSWINVNYTDDIKEVGSFLYLTDRRVYSLFEPRLVNIDFYYKHRTWSTSIQHQIFPKLLSETQFSVSNIDQTNAYQYLNNGQSFSQYKTAEATIALRWSPFSKFLKTPNQFKEIHEGYPKITAQYTQGLKGIFKSNFTYSKIGIKAEYCINRINQSKTSLLFEGDLASGDIPLSHLYHAYPNAPTKDVILQRFSVAGRRTFETMYFGEFFSNKLATLQIKHRIKPVKITSWFTPEVVFISRYAIGDITNLENHQQVSFSSLKHGYQESGFELNKLFAGFGLSFAYRYGAYNLPKFEDNISFKFTFYLKL